MEKSSIDRMPTDLDGKIKLALFLLKKKWRIPYAEKKFILIYNFTTEDLCGAFSCINFNKKVVATVGSSGDQALNAIYLGSNKVYVVDVCPFSKEYFYMKTGVLNALNREDFLSLFGQPGCYFPSVKTFDDSVWPAVRECITDDETKEFWGYLFNKYEGKKIWDSLFDVSDAPRIGLARRINPYLVSNDAYDELRKKLPNASVHFTVNDIFNGDTGINNSIDILYLSNLINYYGPDKIAGLCETEIEHMNKDGIIVASYLYNGI